MNKQTARIYFVMDSKSDKPRMRIEDPAQSIQTAPGIVGAN